MAGINSQRAKIAMINLKETGKNVKAASSTTKSTWSDQQTIQLCVRIVSEKVEDNQCQNRRKFQLGRVEDN